MVSESKEAILSYLIGALADGSLYHNKKHYVYRVTYYQHSQEYLLKCIEPRVMHLFNRKGHFYYDTRREVYFYEITSKQIFQYFKKVIEYFNTLGDYFKDSDKERSDRHYSQAVVVEMIFDLSEKNER